MKAFERRDLNKMTQSPPPLIAEVHPAPHLPSSRPSGRHRLIDTEKPRDKAVLVSLDLPESRDKFAASLDELASLADTAGLEVVARLTQRRNTIDGALYIGSGKAEELRDLVAGHGATWAIFDNDLSPHQSRNLEKLIEARVIDRTELILMIFANNARTHQARLQVELAQAQYALPRLRRMWSHLDRERGARGSRGGAGERQIEMDRRLLKQRIVQHKRELDEIRARKTREVAHRAELFSVALVGYTNAGKSTLMNALTKAGVLAENRLFSTLDTCTRVWELGDNFKALLSDTVGFIRQLPHHLVEAFHATLEEAMTADLLLHVVDASAEKPDAQIDAVNTVLKTLDLHHKPMVLVLNKLDLLEQRGGDRQALLNSYPDAVELSAVTGVGLDALTQRVVQAMRDQTVERLIETKVANGKLIAFLRGETDLLEETYTDDGLARFRIRIDPKRSKKLDELLLESNGGKQKSQRLTAVSAHYEPRV